MLKASFVEKIATAQQKMRLSHFTVTLVAVFYIIDSHQTKLSGKLHAPQK